MNIMMTVRYNDHDDDDKSDLCNGVDHHHDGDHCKGVTDSKLI